MCVCVSMQQSGSIKQEDLIFGMKTYKTTSCDNVYKVDSRGHQIAQHDISRKIEQDIELVIKFKMEVELD